MDLFLLFLGIVLFISQNIGEILKIIYSCIILNQLYLIFSSFIISLWIFCIIISFYILILRLRLYYQEYNDYQNHYLYYLYFYLIINFLPYFINITIFISLFIKYLPDINEYTNVNKDNIIFSIIFSICASVLECKLAYINNKNRIQRLTQITPLTIIEESNVPNNQTNSSSNNNENDIQYVISFKQDVTCSICLEECNECVSLKCSHSYHKDCIEKWNIINKKCPLCRIQL